MGKLTKMMKVFKTLCKSDEEYKSVLCEWMTESDCEEVRLGIAKIDELYSLYCWNICAHRCNAVVTDRCVINSEFRCYRYLPGKVVGGIIVNAKKWSGLGGKADFTLGWKYQQRQTDKAYKVL